MSAKGSAARPRHGRIALAGLVLAFALLSAPTAAGAAARFVVTSPVDAVDIRTGDGICRAFGGECTLRAAIKESNALPGIDTIEIAEPASTSSRSRRSTRTATGPATSTSATR